MEFYKNHLFICNNLKENSKQCCGMHDAATILAYAKQRAKQLNLNKETRFKISGSGCLGRCAAGPVLVIYPQGIWCTYRDQRDIDTILASIAADKTIPIELIINNNQ